VNPLDVDAKSYVVRIGKETELGRRAGGVEGDELVVKEW
jgi:hypothetical protein